MKLSKILALALVLLISIGTLSGTTIAWFTDKVESAGNTIKSGTLEIELSYKDKTHTDWTPIEDNSAPIFNYDKWEPGYTEAIAYQIKNAGNLALKYALSIKTDLDVSEAFNLAEVIDVYVFDENASVDRAAIASATPIGTIKDLVSAEKSMTSGTLLAEEGKDIASGKLVLKMQESAGNDYQNKSIGKGFALELLATQYTHEEDSFNNQYDAEASWEDSLWDGNTPSEKPTTLDVDTVNHIISINNAEDLAYLGTLVNSGSFYQEYGSKWQYTIELNSDINLLGKPWTPIMLSNFVAFEGNGHTIRNLNVSVDGDMAGLFGTVACNDIGVTYVRDLTIDGAYVSGAHQVGAVAGSSPQGVFENVHVNNATLIGTKYVGGIFGHGNGSTTKCSVMNSSICIPEGGEKEAGGLIGYVSNDGKESTKNKVISGNHVENVTIMAPTIASGLVAQPNSSNDGDAIIEIKDNTMKNVTIMTGDKTAALYVSNNVSNKSNVIDNSEDNCTVLHGYATVKTADELKTALAGSGVAVLGADIDMDGETITISNGTKTLDLNGYTLEGVCNSGSGKLLMVNNDAVLNIRDADGDGKISYAAGSSDVGWAINVDGTLNLYSGTIETTGNWNIGYCVDVRPNAWGTAYTQPTVFNMYGGKLKASDGAVRVASTSSDSYANISAAFNMFGGEIEAAFDGVFIQQSNADYDTLSAKLTGGKIAAGMYPVRFFGPNAASVNSGAAKPMTFELDGCTLTLTGEGSGTTWYKENKIALGGGMTADILNSYTKLTIK